MQYNQVLKDLGFSDKEILVYQTLLSLDSAIVSDIAKKAEVNRTSCYDILVSLGKKGLISKLKKDKKTYFHVSDPSRLLDYLEREKEEAIKKINQKQKELKAVLPELKSLLEPKSSKPKVVFYEGEKGMREAYEDTLTAEGGILAYANVKTMHEALPNFFPEYYERRTQANIPIKAIMPANKESIERSKEDISENRESIILKDPEQTFSPEINIYNDKMLISSWKEKMSIIIESKELADAQRLIYKELWKSLKRPPHVHGL